MANITLPSPVGATNPTQPEESIASTLSFLNVLAGIWLIISPFVFSFENQQVALWNSIVIGSLVLVLAGVRTANPDRMVSLSWLNVLLGIWLVISPYVLSYSAFPLATGNSFTLGVTVLLVAICSAATTPAPSEHLRQ